MEAQAIAPDLTIVIPTFKRPEALKRLLEHLAGQTLLPGRILVVDGDVASQGCPSAVNSLAFPSGVGLHWVRSTRSNLPFQRLVGFLVAKEALQAEVVLYLDDDLVPSTARVVEELVRPLRSDSRIVGVTGAIVEARRATSTALSAADAIRALDQPQLYLKLGGRFGGSSRAEPGGLTPSGVRVPPRCSDGLTEVKWLRGGAMACRVAALSTDCFPPTLLSTYEQKLGKGEDTVLSLRLGAAGILTFQPSSEFLHDHNAPPVAYAAGAFRFGRAATYSRRLINDNYRFPGRPLASDRAALILSLGATVVLAGWHVARRPTWRALAFLAGAVYGAVGACLNVPRPDHLNPGVDWQREANGVVDRMNTIRRRC